MGTDIDLRIRLKDGARVLTFELDSSVPGVSYFHLPVGDVLLNDQAGAYMQRLFDELSDLAVRGPGVTDPTQSALVEGLAGMGQRLYRDLLPDGLKSIYRRLRRVDYGRPLALRITSEEPWVPWELVKPFEAALDPESVIDDPFLCESFYMTRWLAGGAAPIHLDVARLGTVAPAGDLEHAARECDHLIRLAQELSTVEALPTFSELPELRRRLKDGDTQLWHFACHGNMTDDPDASAVLLGDEQLRPDDIVGLVELGIQRARPLAFLNACHSGHGGFALTGLGGWAKRLIAAGASGFIGSQWEADDERAADFAIALYDALIRGRPLGEAVHAARQQVKEMDPTNSTWLSYVAYGDPLLEVRMAGQAGPAVDVAVATEGAAASMDGPAFVVGKPIDRPRAFFGRDTQVSRLLKLLARPPLQNAAVIGPKRSGKTSLLRHLRDVNLVPADQLRPEQAAARIPNAHAYRWAMADFQDPRLGTRGGFLGHLLRELRFPSPADLTLEAFLGIVKERLAAPIVILLDEVGVALERYSDELDDEFWEALRWLATSPEGRNLAFVVAAHESPFELARAEGYGSPFFNVFGYTSALGPLSADEARELVASSPIPIPADDADWILERSGRWPILLQILCAERLDALERHDPSEAWKESGVAQMAQHAHLLGEPRA